MSRVEALRAKAASQYAALEAEIESVPIRQYQPVASVDKELAADPIETVGALVQGLLTVLTAASDRQSEQTTFLQDILAQQTTLLQNILAKQTTLLADQTAGNDLLHELVDVMRAPRELIRDKRGKAIGAKIIETE